MVSENVQKFTLKPESELRFEIETKNKKVIVVLETGHAELFGSELVRKKNYEFQTGAKVGIFSYQGCKLSITGEMDVCYIGKETPMVHYLNTHVNLEKLRTSAYETNRTGPITMVVGPSDVGKSTLCKILLNYAVRQGRAPIFVDLDVKEGSFSMPGTIGAFVTERVADVNDGFAVNAPLVYQYGHLNPSVNDEYYNVLLNKLAGMTSKRLEANKHTKSSGMVINTCSWIKDDGHKHILHAAEAFKVDHLFVLGQERLHSQLLREVPKRTQVHLLKKSCGVVDRSDLGVKARDAQICEYFNGKKAQFHPYRFEVKWSSITICKVGQPLLPHSCMPLGMKIHDNKTKLFQVEPSKYLLYHILAMTSCQRVDDNTIQSNICGFVCVSKVDVERRVIEVLSPERGPLPKNVFLVSNVQFME